MLKTIPGLPRGIDGIDASGKISKQDYEQVLEPLLDQARRENRQVSLLYCFGPEFAGFTPQGVWEDLRVGLHSMHLFEACAVVSDSDVLRESVRLLGFLTPCPVRVFRSSDRAEAIQWLSSLREGRGVSHRLLPDVGVIVVEVEHALRVRDFDALAATAKTWLEAHGDLPGLVIHAREFPGWENLAGFLRHLQFVRDQQRNVRRIALVTDSKLASLAPALGEHFIQAELKHFEYGELERAITWAEGPIPLSARPHPHARA